MKKFEKEVLQAFLDEEKRVLAELEDNYAIALHDINLRLENLLGRNDADLPHVIYQIEYQKALKTQVQAILEQLQVNEFETISEYLTRCYNTGFIGSMYSFHKQGLPFLIPIDQKQVVDAIRHKTKLKQKLYDELGVDIKKLQKTIAGEISRGISTGLGYGDMARNISLHGRIPLNRAMVIARTESHRIQCQATSDAQYKAKEKGADVLKQWDATLDGATRPNHRKLDGQIRELDEPFEVAGMKAMFPGGFGKASEDCNCRCAILQRARWALDEEELNELKKRAEYHGLDKSKDFEDFQKKYLKASEQVRDSGQKMNDEDTSQEQAQEYRPIDRSKTVTKQEKGSRNISVRKIENSTYKGSMYISDDVELKPKQMHNIEKSIIDALGIVGDGDNLPNCMIISSTEMQTGAVCAYNAVKNILYIDSVVGDTDKLLELQKDMACPENPLSTYVHEFLHWKDAEKYRSTTEIKSQKEYLQWARYKSKKTLDEMVKKGYNIFEVSKYATRKYLEGAFDETLTECRVLQLLGKGK